jgi:uncharacterized protein YecE (DUF72 family)
MSLPLFESEPEPEAPPQAARLGPRLRDLAARGAWFGTSSWKYEGWLGAIYDPDRYQARGKFSRKRFEEGCLAEFARAFPAVCGDFAYYQFPSPEYWRRLFDPTPDDFRFAFKVPEEITVPRWPSHARYGPRAGQPNEAFLRADVFRTLFARRLEPYRDRVAALIFEFGTMARSTFDGVGAFLDRLGQFLDALPEGFRYSVEIRNPEYLGPAYFDALASRNVAHVFSAWTRMPEMGRQLELPGAFTADFAVARALLARGRTFEQAVRAFEPYERTREPDPGTRRALRALTLRALDRRQPAFLFVNNRLEGHAPTTVEAVLESLDP